MKIKPSGNIERAVKGSLIGTAVGDALGLPYEGMSRQRLKKFRTTVDSYRFIRGMGMISDDAEHALITAEALIIFKGDTDAFTRILARHLKFWLLGIPAGIGSATLKGILKSCFGYSPENSGAFSAGNGPAMRAPVIGVCYGKDPVMLKKLVRASTRITHTDPKAEYGSLAAALAAYKASRGEVDGEDYLKELNQLLGNEGKELKTLLRKAVKSAQKDEDPSELVSTPERLCSSHSKCNIMRRRHGYDRRDPGWYNRRKSR
jgi:ADP-ribosylglycohydrolase